MLDVLGRMTDFLQGLLPSPWLWAVVFVVSAMDALLPFMPSDTTVIVVGVLVVPDPVRLGLLIVIAAAGAMAGDLLGYGIGRSSFLAKLTRDDRGQRGREWAEAQLARHGTALIMLGRYIPGGRVATMLTAGALHYPTRKFLVTEIIAVIAWAVFFALIGYAGGASFQEHPALGMLLAFGIGGSIAVLIEVGRRLVRKRRMATSRQAQIGEESYSLT